MPDLLPCPCCKAKVHFEAKSCPHCGCTLANKKKQKEIEKHNAEKNSSHVGCFITTLIVILLIAYCSIQNNESISSYQPFSNSLKTTGNDKEYNAQKKRGLTLKQRKAIYYQFTDKIQDARIKADKKFPGDIQFKKTKKYNEYHRKLEKQIMTKLARINKLSKKAFSDITFEGAKNNWPEAPFRK